LKLKIVKLLKASGVLLSIGKYQYFWKKKFLNEGWKLERIFDREIFPRELELGKVIPVFSFFEFIYF
jgi:hypothetical protein